MFDDVIKMYVLWYNCTKKIVIIIQSVIWYGKTNKQFISLSQINSKKRGCNKSGGLEANNIIKLWVQGYKWGSGK
jgi:hypothetical protein